MRPILAASLAFCLTAPAAAQAPAAAPGPTETIAAACKAVPGVSADRCDCMGAAIDPDAKGDALTDKDALIAIWRAAIAAPAFTQGGLFTNAEAKSALDGLSLALEDQIVAIYVKALNDITATCRPL